MKLNDYNLKHTGGNCPSCKTQSSVLYDELHGETFCGKCGLVLHSPTRKSIVELIEEAEKKNKEQRNKLNILHFGGTH